MSAKYTFENIREQFPHTKKVVYFNSASYGPFNLTVKDALVEKIDDRLLSETDDSHENFVDRDYLRKVFADLIGAKSSDIGLGMNTTHGLNIAAYGLPLGEGDEVLLSDIEFPALVYTFREAAKVRGFDIKYVKSVDRNYSIDELEKAITPRTRVIAVSFVQFFNGYKLDLERISKLCKKHNIYFVVDGIQGMGVEPINVKELGIDIFSSGCQKWMLATQGIGFFYVAEDIRSKIKNSFFSWLGVEWEMKFYDLFRYNLPVMESAERFELGYYVVLNIMGTKAAVKFFTDLGIENIRDHNHKLIDRLNAYIESEPFYTRTSSMDPKHRSSIYTFTCDNYLDLHQMLKERMFLMVHREGSIRVSVHIFNNEDDIDKLIEQLTEFAGK